MATAKSFADLGKIYENDVFLVESDNSKQTVGKKQDIGDVKLTTEGGDENVKKDLVKPTEAKSGNGKPEDGEKALSQSKKTVTESKKPMKSSLFDTIYKQIVNENEDDLNGPAAGAPDGLDDAAGAAPEGEAPIGGEEEEVIDPVAIVKQLCDLVTKLKTHFGVTDEPAGDELSIEVPAGGEGGVPPVGEAVDMKEVPDSAGKSLQGKNNKVSGVKVNGAGKADGSIKAGDGKLEKGPDGEKLAGNKDNKVKGKSAAVTGGDKSALES